MNNNVFGKMMENIWKRVYINLNKDKRKAEKLAGNPNFQHYTIFDENVVTIHMKKKKTRPIFDKPVCLGMCILDSRKTSTYNFHYNYIKKKQDKNAKLLLMDTDSFAYEIKMDDFYNDISNDGEKMFNASNFPEDHPSDIKTN